MQSRELTATAHMMQLQQPTAAAGATQQPETVTVAHRVKAFETTTAAPKSATHRVMMSLEPTPTTAAHQSAVDAKMLRKKADSIAWDDVDGASDARDTPDWCLRSFPLLLNEYSSSSLIGVGDSAISIRSSDGGLHWQHSPRMAGTVGLAAAKGSGVTSHPAYDISSSSNSRQRCRHQPGLALAATRTLHN
jgi:hypothetical protein